MASKWDTLDMDKAMAEDLDLNAIMTRPASREEVTLFCDKNFPHLHLANMADEAISEQGMSLTQARLPCGWFVFSYRRGDCYLLMMTSRYAGRNHAPLPPSAPIDMQPPAEAESTTDEGVQVQDDEDWDDWGDDGEGEGSRELGWHAMARLAAAEMVDFALEKGMNHAAVIGGTSTMVEAAYLAATGHGDDFELNTDLSAADKKRLNTRVKHLMKDQSYGAEAKP